MNRMILLHVETPAKHAFTIYANDYVELDSIAEYYDGKGYYVESEVKVWPSSDPMPALPLSLIADDHIGYQKV